MNITPSSETVTATENLVNSLFNDVSKVIEGLSDLELTGEFRKHDAVLGIPATMLTLNAYQRGALLTANKKLMKSEQMKNAALGFSGEIGEVQEQILEISAALGKIAGRQADSVKKYFYHEWSNIHYLQAHSFTTIREKLAYELGDALWYIAWLAALFDYSLGDIAQMNRRKLVERHNQPEQKEVKQEEAMKSEKSSADKPLHERVYGNRYA